MPEIPFETFGIATVVTADHPEATSLPLLDDQGKGGAPVPAVAKRDQN